MEKEPAIPRRKFLAMAGLSGASLLAGGCKAGSLPLTGIAFSDADYSNFPALELATSLRKEIDCIPAVEGDVPPELRGALYRVGPGLFERGGLRKRCLLDGDGMVQAFFIEDGGVSSRNRFVRTKKYVEESEAGKYVYPTWSTQAPGGATKNRGGKLGNQASVTVVVRGGKLYALDEFQLPYELNPETLETIGPSTLGLKEDDTPFSAHWKIDGKNGDWIFFGLEYGRKVKLHLIVFDKNGKNIKHQTHKLPDYTYMHDFFATGRLIIINLHPTEIKAGDFVLGKKSLIDSLLWKPEKGNRLLVFDRHGDADPVELETDSSMMWHSLNAYDSDGEVIADFVGYENPDHLIGKDPALLAIMEGRKGSFEYPGEVRRYIIDPKSKKVRQETLDKRNHEFPFVNPHHDCGRHRFGYFNLIREGEFLYTAIARYDMDTGKSQVYDFGPAMYCSEPVFAPVPGFAYEPGSEHEPGWVLTEVLDSQKKKSFLSILRADDLPGGPVANLRMQHHAPLGYHGFWRPLKT